VKPSFPLRLAMAVAMLACGSARADDAPAGVVVVGVARESAAASAGLRTDDRLLSWSQGEASGAVTSPFDLTAIELERGPLGPVRLRVLRGGTLLDVSLFPDEWGIDARPSLAKDAADKYAAFRTVFERGNLADAGRALTTLRALPVDVPDGTPWLAQEGARLAAARRDPQGIAAAIEDGVRAARAAGRAEVEAQLLTALGWHLRDLDRLDEAQTAFARALAARRQMDASSLATLALGEPIGIVAYAQRGPEDERDGLVSESAARLGVVAPESLAHARTLLALGWLQGRPTGEVTFARALAIVERLAPASLTAAKALRTAAWIEEDENRQTELLERARRILERLAPRSFDLVAVLSAQGSQLYHDGDVDGADALHRRAIALAEDAFPGSRRLAHPYNNYASLLVLRGDLVQSEEYYRKALAIDEAAGTGPSTVAARVLNLGFLLSRRRDFEQAEAYLRRALLLAESYSPAGALSGRILVLLGDVRRERGDLADSEALLRRAIEILATRQPSMITGARDILAATLTDAGRYDEAERIYREQLEATAKNSQHVITIGHRRHALGRLAERRGDPATAEEHHRAALAIRREVAPGSGLHAESSHALGRVARARGRKEEALALFEEAARALEAQGRALGGSEETRTRYRAHYQEIYRDLEELLLDLGRERAAFEAVERARARGLLSLLASRDLSLTGDLLAELERDRRRADREHDRAFRAGQEPGLDAAERERRTRALDAARLKQEDVRTRIRASEPRRSAMRDPEPLDLIGVRQALPSGVLLLAYSVGPERGRVYAVGPGPDDFAVLPLPDGDAALRAAVRRFRESVDAHRGSLGREQDDAARRLSALLLAPAAGPLARSTEVLIAPDGPLYLLPWAALPSPLDGRPLVTSKAMHVVSSVTLYETLSRPTAVDAHPQVVGFGDPAYATGGQHDRAGLPPRARSSGLRLDPLPASRREVAALRSLRSDARLLLGPEASETQAKALGRDARYVHFACHGYLDERFPLESGLALATPRDRRDGDNGFLQAWEVFETVRLDADLVTLSACSTGLGEEMGGEGLLGLTWAFQYAGARSVLASLWEVDDEATATLMTHFYRYLAAGVPKAEALRRAQVALLQKRTTSAPYFWAGFTLIGAGQ
jgi:CHAT domain-containing protein/Tfp pilus assembly protein PilF